MSSFKEKQHYNPNGVFNREAERFRQPVINFVGPGEYNVARDSLEKASYNKKADINPFNVAAERPIGQQPKKSNAPGPGHLNFDKVEVQATNTRVKG